MSKKKITKKVKGWAVCFALNKNCIGAGTTIFPNRKEAKTYIKELHADIGGFEDDHHIVHCTISYTLPTKSKKK